MSRFIAWLAFLLGIGASVAANVAHARPEIGPRLASAFAPVALVLAVELAVRLQWRPGWRWMVGRWGGTGLVAVVTAIVSYRHQVGLLDSYGEDAVSAALLPLSVDGLMITAAAALLALGRGAEPVADQVPVTAPAEVTTDAVPRGEPSPRRPRRRQNSAEKVRRAAAKLPTATLAEVAAKAGVSESTARRYVPAVVDATVASPNGHGRN